MSHSCEETYDVYNETVRRARKAHQCDACDRAIRPGDLYCYVSLVFEQRAESYKRCGACQKTHKHLRSLAPGDMWPDERLNCGQRYEDEWGDLPDDVAALAFMTDEEAGAALEPKP